MSDELEPFSTKTLEAVRAAAADFLSEHGSLHDSEALRRLLVPATTERILRDRVERLAGYIAWVSLANPESTALTQEHMHVAFGEWAHRQPKVVYRDRCWFLEG